MDGPIKKITMLGDSSSGKTCYVWGMYAAMSNNRHGFSMIATDRDEHSRLHALWEGLVNETGEDRWPSPTDQALTYAFEFCDGYKPIIQFEWLDYRGSAMSDQSDAQDVKELRNYISESSCLFLCISGEHLREKVTSVNLAKVLINTKASIMGGHLAYLSQTLKAQKRKIFPIVITLTKYDCIDRPQSELIEDVKQLFPPLFAENSDWLVMICPTSLGRELAQDRNSGRIEPKNLDLPVVFALFSILRESFLAEHKRWKEIGEELENLENGWMRVLNRGKIQKKQQEEESSQNKFQETRKQVRILAQELDHDLIYIYFRGGRIPIDPEDYC
jgi:GTPase SAR1 family protein